MSERGREAPKSLDVLELIEAGANMGRCECECVCVCFARAPLSPQRELASSFYRLKEGRVTCTGDLKSRPFLPESGENSWWFLLSSAVEHGAGCGRNP